MFDALPKSIKIAHLDIALVVLDRLDDDCWGYCKHSHLEIQLRRAHTSFDLARETVFHEITHMLCNIYGLEDSEHEKEARFIEEKFVTIISAGWAQIMRDNPKLMRWFTAVHS